MSDTLDERLKTIQRSLEQLGKGDLQLDALVDARERIKKLEAAQKPAPQPPPTVTDAEVVAALKASDPVAEMERAVGAWVYSRIDALINARYGLEAVELKYLADNAAAVEEYGLEAMRGERWRGEQAQATPAHDGGVGSDGGPDGPARAPHDIKVAEEPSENWLLGIWKSAPERTVEAAMRALYNAGIAAGKAEADRLKVPKGWRLVPVEPTERMWDAGNAEYEKAMLGRRDVNRAVLRKWTAMLNAAPSPPSQEEKS